MTLNGPKTLPLDTVVLDGAVMVCIMVEEVGVGVGVGDGVGVGVNDD